MSTEIQDSLAKVAAIPFEATTSEALDETERYHAKIMRDVVLGKLESNLRDAIKKRSNSIYYFLDKEYDYTKPKPHHGSAVISQTIEAIRGLSWVAHASFDFKDASTRCLKIFIQDPETKTRLFPEDDRYEIEFYEGERKLKEIEQASAPKSLLPPKSSLFDTALIALRLKKPEQHLAITGPRAKDMPLREDALPKKSANQKLSEKFSEKAELAKNYAAQIPGLVIDFTPLDAALEKIDALLSTDWDEDVIGASRSSFKSALNDIRILGDSFKEHAQILSVVNKGAAQGSELETLPQDKLSGLTRNFENVTKAAENAARRAINARLGRAEIGVEVQETSLRLHQFRDLELVPVNTAKIEPEI